MKGKEVLNLLKLVRLPPEPIIFLYFCSISFQRFVLPEFIYYSSCKHLQPGNCSNILNQNKTVPCLNSTQSIDDIQSYSSYLSEVAQLAFSVPTILTILVVGVLSDWIGRKPILITATLASILSAIIFLVIYLFNLHPYSILVPNLIDGLGGTHQSVTIAVSAMLADLSSERRRTFRLSILEACILMGTFLFQFISGYLLEWLGFLWSFILVIVLYCITLLYVLLVPESNKKSTRTISKDLGGKILFFIKEALTPLALFKRNKSPLRFAIYLAVFGFIVGDVVTTLNIFPLYALGPPLCWGPSKQGLYFGLTYLARCLGLYLFLPILFKCGIPDNLLILVSIVDNALVYGLTGLFQTDWELLGIVPGIAILASLGVPPIRSSLSKLVEPKDHGSLFSIISLLNAISGIISAVVFNSLYPTLRKSDPGWIFYILGGVTLIPALAVLCLVIQELFKYFKRKYEKEEFVNSEGSQLLDETDVN